MDKPISVKISERRRALGLTQEKLGSLLGVSAQAVSKWENDECLPDVMLLADLCQALRISADALLEVAPPAAEAGSARVCREEVRIEAPGLRLHIAGAEAMEALLGADTADVHAILALLADEEALAVFKALAFTGALTEEALSTRTGLSPEAVQEALFRLLRAEVCQCTPAGYALGSAAYIVFAALAGAYLASEPGRDSIRTITVSYSTHT